MWRFCTNAYLILRWIMAGRTPGLCKTQGISAASICLYQQRLQFRDYQVLPPFSVSIYLFLFCFVSSVPMNIKFNDLIFMFFKNYI